MAFMYTLFSYTVLCLITYHLLASHYKIKMKVSTQSLINKYKHGVNAGNHTTHVIAGTCTVAIYYLGLDIAICNPISTQQSVHSL